jgi:5'-nucleotidase
MWLNGVPVDLEQSYSVTVNSFLASGGDQFFEFANGTGKRDTGKIDLSAMVDYMAEHATEAAPLAPDYSQRAVEVAFPAEAPASYGVGDTVAFGVKSWSLTNPDDLKDATLTVKLGDTVLGTAAVDSTLGTAVYDDYGTASVSFVLPAGLPAGPQDLTLVGATTGTSVIVPVTLESLAPTVSASAASVVAGSSVTVPVTVKAGDVNATGGTVTIKSGETTLGTAPVSGGVASVSVSAAALAAGEYTLSIAYSGADGFDPATGSVLLTVTPAPVVVPDPVKSDPIITKPVPLPKRVTVAGPVKVGGRLTVRITVPKGAKVKYVWFANGKKIARANKKFFKLTGKQRGKRIKVRVTVTKAGFKPTVKTITIRKKIAR